MNMDLALLKKQVGQEIEKYGYELYDLIYHKEKKQNVLTIMIDKPEGISIDDCVNVSHRLSDFLDGIDPIQDAYSLEVSSPGAERELRNDDEIEKAIGKYIHIETYEQKADGELIAYDGDVITIRGEKNKQMSFGRLDVRTIRLAIKF